jgi:ABC-2 type transport system permease protein
MISRVYGLGSVFAKTLLDSRFVVLGGGLVLGLLTLATGYAIADQFSSATDRQFVATQLSALPPLFRGLLGDPIKIETLPGFISWRAIAFMPVMLGLWSVVALSATLAGEAARGTLEMVAAAPISRWSLATQKFAAHAVGMLVAVLIIATLTWLTGVLFGSLPGDDVDPVAAISELVMVGLIALLSGSVAFALAPLAGRTLAAGIAGAYLFGSYVINGYAGLVPAFEALRLVSPFYWTARHRPLADSYDWLGVGLVALLVLVFAALGVFLFIRRDLADTISLAGRLERLPAFRWLAGIADAVSSLGRWSLRGPGRRSFAERLPSAIGWGAALGLYGLVIAASSKEFSETLSRIPQIMQMIQQFYPEIDFSSPGAFLQLALFGFVTLVAAVAAAALVAAWTADERDGRNEVVLSTPLSRRSWFVRSAAALILALLLMSLIIGMATALGALTVGDADLNIVAGGLVIGAYAAALAGVGICVAGLGWPGLAAPVVAVLALAMYLLDLIGGILRLPHELLDLSLARHLGSPLAGSYDFPGLTACLVLAVGGILLGAWRFGRRDLG